MRKGYSLIILCVSLTLMLGFTGCAGSSNVNMTDESTNKSTNKVDEIVKDLNGRKIIIMGLVAPKEDDSSLPDGSRKKTNRIALDRKSEAEIKYNCNIEYKSHTMQEERNMLIDMEAGKNIGDIIYVRYDYGSLDMVRKGLLTPLDEYINYDSGLYSNSVQNQNLWEGKHYGLTPAVIFDTTATLKYNKTMLSGQGLPDPFELMEKGQWTWDAFLDILTKTTRDTDGDGVIDCWGIDTRYTDFLHNFIYTNGGDYIKDENEKLMLGLKSPEATSALQFIKDLYQTHKVVADRLVDGKIYGEGPRDLFAEGKSAFNTMSASKPSNFEAGTVLYPKGPDASGYAGVKQAGSFLAIPSYIEDKKYVADILQTLISYHDASKVNYIDSIEEAKAIYPEYLYNFFLKNIKYSWFFNNPDNNKITDDIYKDILINNKLVDEAIDNKKYVYEEYLNSLNNP